MANQKSKGRGCLIGAAVALLLIFATGWIASAQIRADLAPTPEGDPYFVRYEEDRPLNDVLRELEAAGTIRSARAMQFYARFRSWPSIVTPGTYELQAGMDRAQVRRAITTPVRQDVRIPEGWWIARVAPILERNQVCPADEYIDLANQPELFREVVSFPLPDRSLEGYLYPDTYDFPPLLGCRRVIEAQLRNFERRVWSRWPEGADLDRAVNIGAIIELEVAVEPERTKVAGVIENRLASSRPYLEMDATVLYGIQEWRVLGPGEVRRLASPYNTYLNPGLPPGPIGSPASRSIFAALEPDDHNYFFYVARPDRTHYFSTTYAEHRRFINIARAEHRAEAERRAAEEESP